VNEMKNQRQGYAMKARSNRFGLPVQSIILLFLTVSTAFAGDPQCRNFIFFTPRQQVGTTVRLQVEFENKELVQANDWTVTFNVVPFGSSQPVFTYTTQPSIFWANCILQFGTVSPHWVPSLPGMYHVFATGSSPHDINPNNNTCSSTIEIFSPWYTSSNFPSSGFGADPVNLFLGEYITTQVPDLVLAGPLPLEFRRTYASALEDGRVRPVLGRGWRHTFDFALRPGVDTTTIAMNDGRLVAFKRNGTQWELNGNSDVAFQLSKNGDEYAFADPRDNLLYVFDRVGQLSRIEDGKGNILTLMYNASNQLESVSDGIGRTLTFTHAADSLLESVTDGQRTIRFSYTDRMLASVVDARGNTTTYEYTSVAGLMELTRTVRPEGNAPYTQTYDTTRRVVSQVDAYANTSTITYPDMLGGETVLRDANGNSTKFVHSNTGELLSFTDEAGQSVTFEYANGRRSSLTDRFSDKTRYTYHPTSGKIASAVHANGTTTNYEYTGRTLQGCTLYSLSKVTHPDGKSEEYQYDAGGNLIKRIDRAGKEWIYTYNAHGQALTAVDPTSGTTTFTYNADGTLATRRDHAGNTTSFEYDALFRVTKITSAGSAAESFTYDAHDNLLSYTDARNRTTTYAYDKNDNLKSVTDPLGNTVTYRYDLMDRITEVGDAEGNSVKRTFDASGRVEDLTDESGGVTKYNYDTRGRLTAITDPSNRTWQSVYDHEGIISQATNPLNGVTSFVSDKMGRLSQMTLPSGNVWKRTYDALGRLTQLESPLARSRRYAYDARGAITSITEHVDSIKTLAGYNALGLATTVNDPNGKIRRYAYDEMGRLLSTTDPMNRKTEYEYDAQNRVSKITYPGGLGTLSLAYDATGNVLRKSYSDGTDLQFTYDANGRLLTGNGLTLQYDKNGNVTVSNGQQIQRDASGRIASITYAPGKVVTYTYDARNLLTKVKDWTNAEIGFEYDAVGRLTKLTRPNGVATIYEYDAEHHLIRIQDGTLSDITLTRDKEGKITSAERMTPTQHRARRSSASYTYNNASETIQHTFDALGRQTTDGIRSFAWNLDGRMKRLSDSATGASFTFDALGMRITRSQDDGVIKTYTWNYAFPLPSITIEQTSSETFHHIYTQDGILLATIDAVSGVKKYYHFDEMGNTNFVSNAAGQVTASYAYSPYGALLESNGEANTFTFLGKYGITREDDNLYVIRNRWYDAGAARFLSKDAITSLNPRDINPYQYARRNPLQFVDVDGMNPAQDLQVTIEVRFVSVNENFMERIGVDFDFNIPPVIEPPSLSDDQTDRYRELFPDVFGSSGSDRFTPNGGKKLSEGITAWNREMISMEFRISDPAYIPPGGSISTRSHVGVSGPVAPFPPLPFPKRDFGGLRWLSPPIPPIIPPIPPVVDPKKSTTTVVVPDGGTVVIGGLFPDQNDKGKTPILGDIPLVGNLFRSRNDSKKKELLIFVTPRIVDNQE